MEENPEETFKRLRPTCVKLSKQPTRLVVQELRDSLEFVDSIHLVKLTEYVLFPLQLTLQRPELSNELKQDTVSCIEAVVRKIKVQKLNVFSDLFNVLTVLVSDKEPGKVANVSEELKLATINCLGCLLESSGLVIRSVLYRPKLLPSLGHAISILLDVVQHEKSRELKIASLKCLKDISFCEGSDLNETFSNTNELDESERRDMYMNIRRSASDAMSSFLPGISMALSKVVTGDPTQGHVIITMAIDIWAAVVSMVMNDRCLPDDVNDDDDIMTVISSLAKMQTSNDSSERKQNGDHINSNHDVQSNSEFSKSKNLKVVKNKEWFQTTGLKLKVLFEKLTSVASCHSNWRVRLSLVNFCESVLSNCTETLSCCISLLVDVLVGSLEDEYSQVAARSKVILDSLAKNQDKGKESFHATLEENLHSQLTALPRIMQTADDINKERALNLLNGYMTLLDDRITTILSSSSHLKRLSLALVQILELDTSDVGIVEERTPDKHETAVNPSDTLGQNPISADTNTIQTSQYPRYRFKHFTGDKIHMAICRTCQLLGCHGNLPLLVDHFLDLFHESKVHRKQAVYVINEIVVGFANRNKDVGSNEDQELLCTVKLLLSSYTSTQSWNLLTSMSQQNASKPKHNPSISYQSLNSNILLTCLLLEGIGIFARSLRDRFNPLLIQTLYLVLAKLGDSNAAVSRSAYGTLVMISKSCGYSSVEDLITQNADYLVNSIALDLKYVFANEQAPRVLRVMLQYSNKDILTIIEDTINDVFNVMDLYPDQLIHSLVKVLHALVCALCQWFTPQDVSDQKPQDNPQAEESFAQKSVKLIQDYIKSKKIASGDVDPEDLDEVDVESSGGDVEYDDDDFDKPDEKPEIPLHVKYATEVLEKCIHFLSSSSPVLRILVLDTVYYGVLSLRERENDLLPMIHRLWSPLANRLTDKDQVVISKAIHIISSMADCSGDFMRRRVLKDVFPKLLTLLEKQSDVSLKAGQIYSQSQGYKLQLAAIEGLGRLCKQLEVKEQHLYQVACVCCLYLSDRQPDGLQKAAVAVFEKLIQVDPDVVWLVLNTTYCPALPRPPHHMFTELNLVETGPEAKEYAMNVSLLLGKLK